MIKKYICKKCGITSSASSIAEIVLYGKLCGFCRRSSLTKKINKRSKK